MALVHRVGWDPGFMQRSPWFWPLGPAAEAFSRLDDWPARSALNALLHAACVGRGVEPLRCADNVRREDKRAGGQVQLDRLYDGRIAAHHEVPTRERDWHDFFNALCFATYPRAKLALHRRQYTILQERVPAGASKLPNSRSKEQDALTLFDEGGAALAAEPDACRALLAIDSSAHDERTAELDARIARGEVRIVPFGHALFEHLVEGLRCPGGFSCVLEVERVAVSDNELLAEVDLLLAGALADRTRFVSPREGGHLRLDAAGIR